MLTIAINRAILQRAAVLLKIDVLNSHSISIEGAWALHYPEVPKFSPVTLLSQIAGIFFFSPNGDRTGTTGLM